MRICRSKCFKNSGFCFFTVKGKQHKKRLILKGELELEHKCHCHHWKYYKSHCSGFCSTKNYKNSLDIISVLSLLAHLLQFVIFCCSLNSFCLALSICITIRLRETLFIILYTWLLDDNKYILYIHIQYVGLRRLTYR